MIVQMVDMDTAMVMDMDMAMAMERNKGGR